MVVKVPGFRLTTVEIALSLIIEFVPLTQGPAPADSLYQGFGSPTKVPLPEPGGKQIAFGIKQGMVVAGGLVVLGGLVVAGGLVVLGGLVVAGGLVVLGGLVVADGELVAPTPAAKVANTREKRAKAMAVVDLNRREKVMH